MKNIPKIPLDVNEKEVDRGHAKVIEMRFTSGQINDKILNCNVLPIRSLPGSTAGSSVLPLKAESETEQ